MYGKLDLFRKTTKICQSLILPHILCMVNLSTWYMSNLHPGNFLCIYMKNLTPIMAGKFLYIIVNSIPSNFICIHISNLPPILSTYMSNLPYMTTQLSTLQNDVPIINLSSWTNGRGEEVLCFCLSDLSLETFIP